jgi:hypothetical protein
MAPPPPPVAPRSQAPPAPPPSPSPPIVPMEDSCAQFNLTTDRDFVKGQLENIGDSVILNAAAQVQDPLLCCFECLKLPGCVGIAVTSFGGTSGVCLFKDTNELGPTTASGTTSYYLASSPPPLPLAPPPGTPGRPAFPPLEDDTRSPAMPILVALAMVGACFVLAIVLIQTRPATPAATINALVTKDAPPPPPQSPPPPPPPQSPPPPPPPATASASAAGKMIPANTRVRTGLESRPLLVPTE